MPLLFNSLLIQFGIDPKDVVLLRHRDVSAMPGRTPYHLWRDNRADFEIYQSCQTFKNRSRFDHASHWASFVVTPSGETMLAGVYAVKDRQVLDEDRPQPHTDRVDKAGSCDAYVLKVDKRFADLEGKLLVDWGGGPRAWIQRAHSKNKPIAELRAEFKEPDFPGFSKFREPLSKVSKLPKTWVAILRNSVGIYLLTCPKTKEQYVGLASGTDGFWQRWMDYAHDGHGGNVGLKSRDPSDYQVSILEVAGSSASLGEITDMETNWKLKLQSREMGLNKN